MLNWAIIFSGLDLSIIFPLKLSISSSVDLLYFHPKETDIKYFVSVSEKLNPWDCRFFFIISPTWLSVISKLDPISILSTRLSDKYFESWDKTILYKNRNRRIKFWAFENEKYSKWKRWTFSIVKLF